MKKLWRKLIALSNVPSIDILDNMYSIHFKETATLKDIINFLNSWDIKVYGKKPKRLKGLKGIELIKCRKTNEKTS